MKHLLLAFGIVLVIAGALSIYSGYSIIEIERGWASVIAGATALTGGVITVALAFVLGSLDRLRVALEHAVPETARTAPAAHLPHAPPRANDEAVLREEPVFDTADQDSTAQAEIAKLEPAPAAPPAPDAPAPVAKIPSRAATAFVAAAARARQDLRTEPSINDLWRRVGVNLDAGKSAKAAEMPPSEDTGRAETNVPASTDWLDEALAGFHEATNPGSTEPNGAPPLAPNVPPDQPELEVIGRYEADGTAYVMYADGSIDALSEEGVLRFKSMAELKAFFQG
jgi:hypothetical protein